MRATGGLLRWIALLAVPLAGVGCETLAPAGLQRIEPADRPEAIGAPDASAGDETPKAALPPEVNEALLPPIRMPIAPGPAAEEPRFDLAVMDAPARHFFMDLVQGTPYDVVIHPEVTGTISLTLKDATIPEILDAVREVYGYEFRRTARGFFALPARLQSRTFHVDYLHVQRVGQSQTRVSAGQVSDQVGGAQGGGATGTAATTGGERRGGAIESSQVTTNSNMDFWQELTVSLRAIIGSADGRSVVVSPQAGIVVVRAMPGELRQAEEYLSRAQVSLQRQVILEAKILEVELEDGFHAGINWELLIETGGKSFLAAQTGGATLLGGAIARSAASTDPDDRNPVSNLFSLALDLDDFSALINLLETQGRVRVLSSPRISTVNNQKAVIKVGSDEFFVTDISTTTVTGTATTTSPNITLTPFFSGIALDVTPQISASGDVILHVHPSVTEVSDQEKVIGIGDDEQLTLPLAFSTIRESDSIVRARSGQMIAIGGLMKEAFANGRAATPVLGRIPFLGALFRQTRQSSRKSELVILLRPTVVRGDTWAQELRRQERRFDLPLRGLEAEGMSLREGWSTAP